ncbi:hypothetical protein [Apibacter sp. B2912]|uniref:hypothetical protein n=1 Tax=Apibacter sp. B2912 TaxID=2656763 RepID=UPI0013722482|nr:hypothetical protein [Apibacter sp. B2912]MXO32468.1 hypothetical protein [Apibacter sp. B2912]
MKIKNLIFWLPLTLLLVTIFSCSSHDRDDILNSLPEHDHDEMSKVILQFRNSSDPNLIREYVYEVPEGSNEIPITDISLPTGTYNVEIKFYSQHENHLHDVTDEIFIEDADDHFVFYQKVDSKGLSITYADHDNIDTLGRKLGHHTVWTVEDQAFSTVYIYLLHQPAKKDPEATSAALLGGEIDLEAHFNVNLQNNL